MYGVKLIKLLYEAVFGSVRKAILSLYSRRASPTIRRVSKCGVTTFSTSDSEVEVSAFYLSVVDSEVA